eukprot:TRINITY_DN3390_c0_g1_i1.p1 TRINITY_DN3390_c0_g1~~TRINITY_DN3390_c0_g1_i1.p1  ORF type:complete len:114 (+),score=7.28 TRINITY_DN3390_c0_g1_i1:458-799(+)
MFGNLKAITTTLLLCTNRLLFGSMIQQCSSKAIIHFLQAPVSLPVIAGNSSLSQSNDLGPLVQSRLMFSASESCHQIGRLQPAITSTSKYFPVPTRTGSNKGVAVWISDVAEV